MKWVYLIGAVVLLGAIAAWVWPRAPQPIDPEMRKARQAVAIPALDANASVYYLGHSLIGRDIPVFVQQLAQHSGRTQNYHSQLGWGASLRDHWEPKVTINGFDDMNHPPAHRDPKDALSSGTYDAFIFTEMVDLRDAIRWHHSGRYAGQWAAFARSHRADARIYLYETWHDFSVEGGWLARIASDLEDLWMREVIDHAMAYDGAGAIHVIPVGTALAALVRKIEDQGLAQREDLMAILEDGTSDTIHLGDIGAYFAALVTFATLYHQDPRGLPHELRLADGSAAQAPDPALAQIMQQVVWDVVRAMPATGVSS